MAGSKIPYNIRHPKPPPSFLQRWWRFDAILIGLTVALGFLLVELFGPAGDGPVEVVTTTFVQENAAGVEEDTRPVAKAGPPVCFLMQNVQNYFVQGEVKRSRYSTPVKKEADREAVADTIASMQPEIVGLVEIGGPMALDDLAARLQARGLEYPHRFVLTRAGEDRALAILSMHPIVRNDSKANYGLFGDHRRRMLRGILDVTVQTKDGREFRILGAHLKSHKGNTEEATRNLRTQEARTLAIYVQKIMKARPKMPILVYGDWNDGPADSSLGILSQGISKESALTRLKPADEQGDEWTHYFSGGGQYLIYDQIYVNAPLRSRMGRKSRHGVVGKTPNGRAAGSDHRAVWCELR